MIRLAAVAVTAVVLAGCSEHVVTVDDGPDAGGAGTVDPWFIGQAEAALQEAPEPNDGWRTGVVLAEDAGDKWDAAWSVLTTEDVEAVQPATTCNDGDSTDEDQLVLLIDPGDLVSWSTAGGDNRVCTAEIEIVRKAAALHAYDGT